MGDTLNRTSESSIEARDLKAKLDRNESLIVFDVRARDDVETWRVEGKNNLTMINIPYREMVPAGGADRDPVGKIQAYVQTYLQDELRENTEIVTVCPRGISSQDVTEALRKLNYEAETLEGGMEAWATYYDIQTVVADDRLQLYQVTRPARGCISHLVISDGQAAVVDPLRHVETYLDIVREAHAEIAFVMDTHAHADHLSGGPELAERLGVPYYLHPYDAIHPLDVRPAEIDYTFIGDEQTLNVGDVGMEMWHIPGHTLGNMACLVDGTYLMTGDSIFITSIARPDLGGQGETWASMHYRSLRRLLALDETTIVLPGHFSGPEEAGEDALFADQLGKIMTHNEGLRKVQEGEPAFMAYILQSLPTFPESYVEIKRANAGLMEPDEDKARELETGRNACALSST